MEHKVTKLKDSQEKMATLVKELHACTDKKKTKKLETKLIRLINQNVSLVLEQ
jgi:hypothetical protein